MPVHERHDDAVAGRPPARVESPHGPGTDGVQLAQLDGRAVAELEPSDLAALHRADDLPHARRDPARRNPRMPGPIGRRGPGAPPDRRAAPSPAVALARHPPGIRHPARDRRVAARLRPAGGRMIGRPRHRRPRLTRRDRCAPRRGPQHERRRRAGRRVGVHARRHATRDGTTRRAAPWRPLRAVHGHRGPITRTRRRRAGRRARSVRTRRGAVTRRRAPAGAPRTVDIGPHGRHPQPMRGPCAAARRVRVRRRRPAVRVRCRRHARGVVHSHRSHVSPSPTAPRGAHV